MRNIAVVALSCVFAVGVAGQQQPAERPVELAGAFVALEQEHDLDKAVRLFAAAMDDAALGTGVREAAAANLHGALLRLGRKEEAVAAYFKALAAGLNLKVAQVTDGAQDPEREKELRDKARELLSRLGKGPSAAGGPIPGLSPELGEQLLWIGQPAAPEIIARLQSIQNWPSPEEWATVPSGAQHMADNSSGVGLMRVLWKLRGPQADAFLTACAADPKLSWVAARTAGAAGDIDPSQPLFRAYLEHEDPRISRACLDSDHLSQRLAPSRLLDIAERGGAALRGHVLEVLSNREFDVALLPRAHDLARRGLAGTDPQWGKAAERFVCSVHSQRHADGLRLLLANLPQLRAQNAQVHAYPVRQISGPSDYTMQLDAALLRELLPAIDACAKQLGDVHEARDSACRWLQRLMWAAVAAGDAATMRLAMAWWDRGFDMLPVLDGRVTTDNAALVFERRREVPADRLHEILRLFHFQGALPREMFEPLTAVAGDATPMFPQSAIAYLLVRTGDERVVDWLLAQWRADRVSSDRTEVAQGAVRVRQSKAVDWVAGCLIEFARTNRGERVRAAMRELLQAADGQRPGDDQRPRVLLALLASGDEAALGIVAADAADCVTRSASHPFAADRESHPQSPLQYLVSGQPRPPHPFTEQQVFDAVQQLLRQRQGGLLDPGSLDVSSMSERLVALFAVNDPSSYDHRNWQDVAVAELSRRMEIGDPTPALARWFGEQLAAHDGSDALLVPCYPNVVVRFREQLAAVLTGDEARWAYRAAQLLWQVDRGVDITAALQNRHGLVRQWAVEQVVAGEVEVPLAQLLPLLADSDEDVREELARHFGAIVSKEAVPELIGLLRDPVDSVRTAAAEALTRIRFFHEQQAHWERVLKGMDATPASACEKLLLQARPGQPAAQRLLAIESLGTLGVPEALPFLIDWTTDPDDAVAEAARAAITAIHLAPRR